MVKIFISLTRSISLERNRFKIFVLFLSEESSLFYEKVFFEFLSEITYFSAAIGSKFCFVGEIEWNSLLNTFGQKNINTQNLSYV